MSAILICSLIFWKRFKGQSNNQNFIHLSGRIKRIFCQSMHVLVTTMAFAVVKSIQSAQVFDSCLACSFYLNHIDVKTTKKGK